MLMLTNIIGHANDPNISGKLHELSHTGRVEYLLIDRDDTLRHRLRATTDRGTECAVALPRGQKLEDGSVIFLTKDNAIVIRMSEEHWLAVKPHDAAAAIALGYFVGNLHWRVRFRENIVDIAVEGDNPFISNACNHFSMMARQ